VAILSCLQHTDRSVSQKMLLSGATAVKAKNWLAVRVGNGFERRRSGSPSRARLAFAHI